MHTTSVRFGDDTWAALSAEAAREGMPVSHLIREAVAVRVATGLRPTPDAELRRIADDHELRLVRLEQVLGGRRR